MAEPTRITARYYPEIFNAQDLQRAKHIILTPEGPGADTETRWAHEAPYVLELIRQAVDLSPDRVVLDYGCGIGRLAKAMIEASGCSVIGVDISPDMRRLAMDYVGSDRFTAMPPDEYDSRIGAGLRIDAAIAVWVLQHCFTPSDDIARIRRGLADGGNVFVLNMPKRAIPAVIDDSAAGGRFIWAPDKIDVAALLRTQFDVLAEGVPDRSRTPNMGDVGAYWMNLRPRAE